MRKIPTLLAAVPLVALPLLTAGGAPASAGAATAVATHAPACRGPLSAPSRPVSQPVLLNVRVGRHDDEGFDRTVFDLRRVSAWSVRYERQLIQDGSGLPLALRGRAVVVVRLEGRAHSLAGEPTAAPARIRPNFQNLVDVRRAGDFEGLVTYGLGLRSRAHLRAFVLSNPTRLVVDVALPGRHPFRCH